MQFNIGNGLSAMGGAISQTAGAMALENQKADLERQKEILANDLATTRESTLEDKRQAGASALEDKRIQGQKDLIPLQTKGQIEVEHARTTDQIMAHAQELQQDTDAAVSKLQKMSSPDMLAAQHAIAMASVTPNLQLQIQNDGTAATFNPVTGKVSPMTGPDGQPIRFQNPALMQAYTEQTRELGRIGMNLDSNYAAEKRQVGVLMKDATPEEQAAANKAIDDKYDPLMAQNRAQIYALKDALGARTGTNTDSAPSAGAPPVTSFFGKGSGVAPTPPTAPGSASVTLNDTARRSGLILSPAGQ